MKKLLSAILLCAAAMVSARAEPIGFDGAPVASAAKNIEYVNRDSAVVRVMNKSAGKTKTVTLPVGKSASFEKLNLTVRACKETPPYERKDFFMFIEVEKTSADAGRIFSGWMTSNDPGYNPLRDADYDLWLVGCE